jgi:hypothetical protein
VVHSDRPKHAYLSPFLNSKKKKEKRRTRREKRRKEEKKGRKRKWKEGKKEERFREQSINRDDESSVGGGVGRFFFQSPGGLPKTRASTRVFGSRGLVKKNRPTQPPTPESFLLEKMLHVYPYTTCP